MSVKIHPLFWLFAILIGVLNSMSVAGTIIWVIVILISLLVHEFGHALTAKAFGQRPKIQLMIFGGVTYREGPDIGLAKDFLVTLNGPLAGLALCGVAFGILQVWTEPPIYIHEALRITVFVNLFWTIINLLPILPLDGGHLLRIILEGIFGAKGASFTLLIGAILGGAIAILGLIMGYLIIGLIFFFLTFESFRTWRTMRYLEEPDRSEPLQRRFQEAQQKAIRGEREEALAEFEEIRQKTGKGLLYQAATEEAARLIHDPQQAYDYLSALKGRLAPDIIPLFHELAYQVGNYEEAVRLGKHAYQLAPTAKVAYTNALSHAALHQARETVGWLKCAERAGMPIKEALANPVFDNIRRDPLFQALAEG